MNTPLFDSLRRRLENFHHAQGGAIIILVLAGFLILVLSSLMMLDAGRAASDKMEIQTAADTAAFSQSVIKARTMNMVTYANTAKRMFYAYIATYFAAWTGLLAAFAYYSGDCFKWLPNPHSCYRWAIGLVQIIAQTAKFIGQDVWTMSGRSVDEVKNLDAFQNYMINITPWWAYAENLVRGMYNGATATAAWPPPKSNITAFLNKVYEIIQKANELLSKIDLGINFSDQLDKTGKTDSLPLKKQSGFLGHTGYCGEYILSPEQLIAAADHFLSSKSGAQGISRDGVALGATGVSLLSPTNCIMASFFLGDAVLDYRVDKGTIGFGTAPTKNEWMQSTSNITMAYMAGGHRKHSRTNFNRLLNDHDETTIMRSNGYWALARSEFVYGDSYMTKEGSFFSSIGSALSRFSAGLVAGLIGEPNMWSPRWTAKLRPMALPGENLGSTILNGKSVGLGPIFRDSLPYFAVASLVSGLFDKNFDFNDAVLDFAYYFAASAGFSGDHLEGLTQ